MPFGRCCSTCGRQVELPHCAVSRFFLFLLTLSFFPAYLFSQKTLPDSVALQTVVIQATRADAKNPIPHTNISDAKIAQMYHAQDVPFLLTGVPSLVETSDAGTGVGYTGLRIRGSDPTRVNVTINGVPLNDAESQGVFWVDLPDLAASAAEIQVQRGVGTSTNGAGAFGATVNLDLSKVEPDPFAEWTGSMGSFDTRKLSARFGTGLIRGKLAFGGRFSKINSNGYIDRASADLRSLHFSGAYIDERQSLQMHWLDGHTLTYQAWNGVPAQYIDDDKWRTFNTAGTERAGSPYEDEVDDYTQRHLLLHYKRLLPHGLSLQLNGHYTRGFGFYEQYKAGEAFSDYGMPDLAVGDTVVAETDLVRRRWLDNDFYGGTFALRWQPPVNLPWMSGAPVFTLGGAASRYEGGHFGEVIWAQWAAVPKDFRYYDNDADKRDANAFFKLEMGFAKGFSTFLDLQVRRVRYSFLGYDNDLNNVTQTASLTFFNPKIGATYSISRNWKTYGFFGVGNREPNRDDYTQSSPSSRPRPERLFDFEGGLKTGGTAWNAMLNFFHMQYRDQLAPDGRLNDVGAYIRTNVPDSYRAGMELEVSGRVGARWMLSGNASLSRNKIRQFAEYRDNWDTGEQEVIVHRNTDLAFSPNATARGEATYYVLQKSRHVLALSLSGKYVGQQYLDNTSSGNTVLSDFFFSDARLNYDLNDIVGEKISLVFSINNLFDARYASNGWAYRFVSETYDPRPDDPYSRSEGAGVYNLTGYFPQAGRHWMASVRIRF
ncbi:MAG: Vitamin B12 transporter BtuB [Saprospiraceae bacterium]|nr:Vitamin B12 transporter BtuB [Saprospiraceae bacterium]